MLNIRKFIPKIKGQEIIYLVNLWSYEILMYNEYHVIKITGVKVKSVPEA